MEQSIGSAGMKKMAWTVLDQGLFSGTNFLLNVYLARVLDVEEYGGFAIGYSVFLFAANINKAYLVESFLVLGSGKYKDKVKDFLGIIFYQHIIVSVLAAICFVPIYFIFLQQSPAVIQLSVVGAILSVATLSLLWVLRRAAYIFGNPKLPAFGGTIYLGLVFLLLFLYDLYFNINVFDAFLVLSLASFIVSILFIVLMKPTLSSKVLARSYGPIFRDQWSFGKWSILSALMNWIPNNLFIYLLLYFYSLREPAQYKAILNIVVPVQHLMSGLSLILLPKLSRLVHGQEFKSLVGLVRLVLLSIAVGCSLYTFILVAFGNEIFQFIYGGNYQFDSTLYFWVSGFLVFSIALNFTYASVFRALSQPKKVVYANVFAVAFSLILGTPLIMKYSVIGAVSSLFLVNLIGVIFYISLNYKRGLETIATDHEG